MILAATLNAVPAIPAIGLVLVLSVDWFIGVARAVGNLIGNCVATVVVAGWEGDLDRARARTVFANPAVDLTALSLASEEDGVRRGLEEAVSRLLANVRRAGW